MAFRRPRLPNDLTPEEREARIAELRARRHARMRKLAIRSAIGSMALALLAAVALYWLLSTFGGRDFLLARIVGLLPAGTELTWSRAEGPVRGPLTMHDVRYVQRGCPDVDGKPVAFGNCATPTVLTFTAARVTLNPEITPLIGRRLRLDWLQVVDATLDLPVAADEPFELPRWPESLPAIELPLSLESDVIEVDGLRVTRAAVPVIDIARVRGGLDARDGWLRVAELVVHSDRGVFRVHGDYAPRDNYRMDLSAGALLPAPLGRTRPRIGLVARGDLASMDVVLSGRGPTQARAHLRVRGADVPVWTLVASSDAFDPALLSGSGQASVPLAFSLRADGEGGAMRAQGRVERDGAVYVLQPSALRIEDQVLDIERLVLDAFQGRIVARGRGDFSQPDDATFKFAINARGLTYTGSDEDGTPGTAPAIGVDADFGIAGRTAAWAAIGKATLSRDGQQALLDFDGRGDGERMTLQRAHVAMPTGTLDATGDVAWAPALQWQIDAALAGFDPGYFAPDWRGAVNGRFTSTGNTRDDEGLDIVVDASDLGGNLRGRRLDGRANVSIQTPAPGSTRTDYAGDIALTLGSSRIDAKGRLADVLDVDARLAPLDLADLLPNAAGTLRGRLQLAGARTAPDVDVDLDGSGLRWGDYRAATLRAQGRLPWRTGNGALQVEARELAAGIELDALRVDAQGSVERLQMEATTRSQLGALALAGNAERQGEGWRGTLASLRLAPTRGAAWRLQSPAQFTQRGSAFTLSESCFAAENGTGALCANADWPRRGVAVNGNAVPLSLLSTYLPERDGGRPWILRGAIDIDGQLRPVGGAWQGQVAITSAEGGLRNSERSRRDIVGYRELALQAAFDPTRIQATLRSAFNEGGLIDARVATGWDAFSPLDGEIAIDISELTWIELFSPDIVEPTGQLTGRITLAGTRAEPALGGYARLTDFRTELPAMALLLEDGDIVLDALPDGSARITGSVRSGEGTLWATGSLDWRGGDAPLVLQLHGSDVLLSDTRDLRLVADPDITLRYAAGRPLDVSGTVTVPSALLDLERLDDGVSVSPDVVVLDPVDPERGTGMRLLLDLTLAMGDDVRLRGFGLDGTLGGNLRVRAQPGREMLGYGRLEVGGRYRAYGQELQITRGNLVFNNGPVSDPLLDIRAERRIEAEDITAGISVTGRASAPNAEVWTNPASDTSQALSYLALGRSISNVSSAEGRQLDAASAALTAGGSMLAGQLGSNIGLDDAGVMHSRALGGSVLGIGKQISPRVYVGFGVSLLGTGQVLTLKYLLRAGFDIEIESSTIESRGSINWRHESD
ncbi:translocation/assembly module TamB [Luteimonas aestuarii]|uniref:Translocation/assembly module TamB n=1 Tax=Luteimonas aestuarii TaxID=453837 RepID=A0A4R5TK95_9GAMM|nr:translocation/assembly module TamB domain-containing protein [Luteimonas aestuarii]TDK19564.1 translocation/assembly module TamB [Luteimonas aestuarii]